MARIIEIPIEPLTEANFAPFGQLLGERSDKPHYQGATVKTWDTPPSTSSPCLNSPASNGTTM